MIRQQKFERAFAGLANLGRIGMNHHAFSNRQRAGNLKLGSFLNFHQTHAAGGLKSKTVVITECRDGDARLFCGVDEQRSRRGLQLRGRRL